MISLEVAGRYATDRAERKAEEKLRIPPDEFGLWGTGPLFGVDASASGNTRE